MKIKQFMVLGIFLALNFALAGCHWRIEKSITVENISGLKGKHISLYVFEELPSDGNFSTINTAVGHEQFNEKNSYYDFYLQAEMTGNWRNGTGKYYVAIDIYDNDDHYSMIKDAYIFMDENNTPAKVPLRLINTKLDFRNFNKGTVFYHSEIAKTDKNDLIYEYDPLYEGSLNYENDLLIDVVYEGDISLLDKAIDLKMLDCFNPAELRLLRNIIFAKYNYEFGSKYLRDYFSKFSWYKGDKDDVLENMTATDWQNISITQDLEKKFSGYLDGSNFGESFTLKGQIGRFEHYESYEPYRTIVKKVKVDGEITAMFRARIVTYSEFWKHEFFDYKYMENAKAKITDNQFILELGKTPSDLLYNWDNRWFFWGFYSLKHAIPETKYFLPTFCISGTYIDQYDTEQSVNIYDFREYGNGYNFTYSYLYVDGDTVIQGLKDRGERDSTNGLTRIYPNAEVKMVISLHLKKGWNKIKYSVTYNGKYIIQKNESSPENGFYIIGKF